MTLAIIFTPAPVARLRFGQTGRNAQAEKTLNPALAALSVPVNDRKAVLKLCLAKSW